MTRQRLTVSILLAVLIHAAVLLLVQLFLHLAPDRMPEYSGPLIVTLEETPMTPVLERVQERQAQPQAAQPAAQAPQTVQPESAPSLSRSTPQPQTAPRVETKPASSPPRTTTQPSPAQPVPRPVERPAQGTRQVVPAEPLGTLPPVAPEDTTPYAPQTFTQPLADQGPVRAAPSGAAAPQQQAPSLDTSRLDAAIGQTDSGVAATTPSSPRGASPGAPGSSQSTVEGFQIQWQNPSEGRQVVQSAQPEIPAWVSREGLRLQVAVSFVLQPSGYLRDIRIAASSGYSDVDTAVVAALRRWRFSSSPGAPDVRGEVTYLIIPR